MINNVIDSYISLLIGKPINECSSEDLANVSSLPISEYDMFGEKQEYDFNKISGIFPNVNTLRFANIYITKELIEKMIVLKEKIVDISFEHCFFTKDVSFDEFKNLSNIYLYNCDCPSYSFFKNLLSLRKIDVINPRDDSVIDFGVFNKLINLNALTLNRCIIDFEEEISNLKNLRILNLLWTSVNEEKFKYIFALENLEKLFVSKKYDSIVSELNKDNMVDVRYDLISFTFENYEENNVVSK